MNIPFEFQSFLTQWRELHTFDSVTGESIQCWSGVSLETSGAYILHHPASGCFYVGSSGCITSRLTNHRNQLLRREHFNSSLQNCFDQGRFLLFAFITTSTREGAFDVEQRLLDANQGNTLMLNVNTSARLSGAGRRPSEETLRKLRESQLTDSWREKNHQYTKSPEHSTRVSSQFSKSVNIGGVHYPSAVTAARALNLHENTVRSRIKSSNPLFQDWFWEN